MWPWCGVWSAALRQPPCVVAGVLDERLAVMGSPLVLGRRGRKCCPCVDVLTDGGPEAVTKQETEKVVGVEPSA